MVLEKTMFVLVLVLFTCSVWWARRQALGLRTEFLLDIKAKTSGELYCPLGLSEIEKLLKLHFGDGKPLAEVAALLNIGPAQAEETMVFVASFWTVLRDARSKDDYGY